jgi:hypothetical protein
MSTILEKLTGLGLAITFEGKKYTLAPMRLLDIAELKAAIRKFIYEEAERVARGFKEHGMPESATTDLWKEVAEYVKTPLQSPAMNEPEMVREFYLLSLRHNHPEAELPLVDKLLADPDVLETLRTAARELNKQENDLLGKAPAPTTSGATENLPG